jgi:hypothetical protein
MIDIASSEVEDRERVDERARGRPGGPVEGHDGRRAAGYPPSTRKLISAHRRRRGGGRDTARAIYFACCVGAGSGATPTVAG